MKHAVIDQSAFEKTVNALPDDALSGLRSRAASEFAKSGFPTPGDEDWKYTNLMPAVALSNAWMTGAGQFPDFTSANDVDIVGNIDAYWVVIENGQIKLDTQTFPDNVTVSLMSAAFSDGDISADDAMTRFNAALLTDAIKITIETNTTLDKPVGILINDEAPQNSLVTQSRVVINIQDNANAKFIEAHVSAGAGEHFANNVVQLNIEAGGIVSYSRLQIRARHHIQTNKLSASIADGACLNHCAFDIGGSLVRNDVSVDLHGRGSSVTMNGLYLAGDRQHIDNHTRVDHRVGPSESREEYRGILNRKSRCVFNGKAVVHKGADGADAQQANHNLLLSGDAEIDTKPELEIYADDVKCSHGATVGQLDESAMFYIRSRGLGKDAAMQLMTRAFAQEVIGMNPVAEAQDFISAAIDARLDSLIRDTHDE